MTNHFIDWQNKKRKNMSYREILVKQISELEQKIASDSLEKEVLQKELSRLKLAEYEEEWKETQERRLLQEGC